MICTGQNVLGYAAGKDSNFKSSKQAYFYMSILAERKETVNHMLALSYCGKKTHTMKSSLLTHFKCTARYCELEVHCRTADLCNSCISYDSNSIPTAQQLPIFPSPSPIILVSSSASLTTLGASC